LKLLLDEMYPPALAKALREAGIEASTALELALTGRSDPDLLAAAIAQGYTVLTENVADFARISAEHVTAGHHHSGVLIALSSRFTRRPVGISPLVAAITAVASEQLDDRLVYLERADQD
jgi:predicted nuclease of predicted toxin-antitoxin system